MDNTDQTSLLVEQLKTHFGLHTNPFSPTLSAFYGGGQRQHTVETLRHLAIFGDMVLLLTGDKGAGKTTLIEHFSKLFESEINLITLAARPDLSAPSSVNRLAIFAGLRALDSESASQTLVRLVQKYDLEYQKTAKRTLVVIDDADLLPEEELDLYVEVFGDLPPESGIVLLMVGLPALVEHMVGESRSGREQWLHHIHLKPLASSEVLEYLQLRLQAAGCVAPLVLSEGQASNLHEMGKGLPGRINRVFVGVILGQYGLTVQPAKTSNISRIVVIMSVAVLLFSFMLVSYQYGIFDFSLKSGQLPEPINEVLKPTESTVDIALKASEERLKLLDKALEQTKSLNVSDAELSEEVEALEPVPSVIDPPDAEVMQENEITADVSSIDPSSIVVSEIEDATEDAVQVEPVDVPTDAQLAPDASNQQATAVPESLAPPGQSIAQEKVQMSEPKADVVRSTSSYFRSRDWVQSQPASGYSAQVLGSYRETSAIQFIEKSGALKNELFYVQTVLKGKPWYVVLYGQYQSKTAAKEAIAIAPTYIAKERPWLRTFGDIAKSFPE